MAFLEFLRDRVVESAANTFTESEIKTPASRSESLAMLIWMVEFFLPFPSVEDGEQNVLQAHLAKKSQSAIINLEDSDLIAIVRSEVDAGGAQGSLSEYQVVAKTELIQRFDPPILYPKAEMFLGIAGVGNAAALAVSARVGYTLEKVNAGDFIAALVD